MKRSLKNFLLPALVSLLIFLPCITAGAQEIKTTDIPSTENEETATVLPAENEETTSAPSTEKEETTAVPPTENEETTIPFVFEETKLGDTDGDGKVTASDARLILRCSVELEEKTEHILAYGDFDKDSKLSSDDARTALRVSVALDSIQCILHGHETEDIIRKPTCTEEGYTEKHCKSCSFIDSEKTAKVPAYGHKLTENTTKASCTSDGVYTCKCSVCGFVKETKLAEKATGHKYGVWKLQGETKSRVCNKCSFTETAKNVKTIYLTFDDGPGPYTAKLLGYLREYNVKATFFVTNQMPQYRYLLKDIVNDGHGIAVHSLTHQWSIYFSEQSYLKDFNAMHKIILDDTRVDTKIFRFPGGTNNTVSRSYSRGIMSSMAKRMTEAGYVYFDWNVDSGDTMGYGSSKIAQYTINQIKGKHTSVVLMHDIKNTTVEAIKTIIRYGLDNGYEFAVIDESTPRVQFRPAN